jgi:hypothetical protein
MVEGVLDAFFAGDKEVLAIIRRLAEAARNRPKTACLSIDDKQVPALEFTLTKKELPYHKKSGQHGKVHFRITYRKPEELIYLGMAMQKAKTDTTVSQTKRMVL